MLPSCTDSDRSGRSKLCHLRRFFFSRSSLRNTSRGEWFSSSTVCCRIVCQLFSFFLSFFFAPLLFRFSFSSRRFVVALPSFFYALDGLIEPMRGRLLVPKKKNSVKPGRPFLFVVVVLRVNRRVASHGSATLSGFAWRDLRFFVCRWNTDFPVELPILDGDSTRKKTFSGEGDRGDGQVWGFRIPRLLQKATTFSSSSSASFSFFSISFFFWSTSFWSSVPFFFYCGPTRTVYRVLPSFLTHATLVLGFPGFHQVVMGFTGFHWVSVGFTKYYRVLLGFTGF